MIDAPDPEGMSLLAKVVVAGTAVVTPVWGLFKLWNKKADRHTVNNQIQEVKNEVALHRGYFKDVFNMIRENEQRAQDRHERLMERLSARGNKNETS